jgi:hypothetical protein
MHCRLKITSLDNVRMYDAREVSRNQQTNSVAALPPPPPDQSHWGHYHGNKIELNETMSEGFHVSSERIHRFRSFKYLSFYYEGINPFHFYSKPCTGVLQAHRVPGG